MKGVLLLDRAQHAGDHGLARRHAERAGHEAEILRGGDDVLALEHALADQHRVIELGVARGGLEAVGVAAAVAELERVVRRRPRTGTMLVLAVVEEMRQALAARSMRMW